MNFPKYTKAISKRLLIILSATEVTLAKIKFCEQRIYSRYAKGVFNILLIFLLASGLVAGIYVTVDPNSCRLKGEELQLPYHWTFSEGCKVEIEEGYWISPSEVTTWLLKKVKSTSPQ